MKRQPGPPVPWQPLRLPEDQAPPRPLAVRVQSLPAHHHFPEHRHPWHQFVYASSGVLTVTAAGQCFVIAPQQAVWVPAGLPHRTASLLGAEFRSLYVDAQALAGPQGQCTLLAVTPFLRALILEAGELLSADPAGPPATGATDEEARHLTALILARLARLQPLPASLPWPQAAGLGEMCEALYANPTDERDLAAWAAQLHQSGRTLSRHFQRETGMTLRAWRQRLRLFKAVELLAGGQDVTQVALALGYASPSAFTAMFRQTMGQRPSAYRQQMREMR